MRLTDLMTTLMSMAKAAMPHLFDFGGPAPAAAPAKPKRTPAPRKSFEERKAHLRAEVRVDKRGRRSTRWVSTEQKQPAQHHHAMPSLFDLAHHMAHGGKAHEIMPSLFDAPAPTSSKGQGKDKAGSDKAPAPLLLPLHPTPQQAAAPIPPKASKPAKRPKTDYGQAWQQAKDTVSKPDLAGQEHDPTPPPAKPVVTSQKPFNPNPDAEKENYPTPKHYKGRGLAAHPDGTFTVIKNGPDDDLNFPPSLYPTGNGMYVGMYESGTYAVFKVAPNGDLKLYNSSIVSEDRGSARFLPVLRITPSEAADIKSGKLKVGAKQQFEGQTFELTDAHEWELPKDGLKEGDTKQFRGRTFQINGAGDWERVRTRESVLAETQQPKPAPAVTDTVTDKPAHPYEQPATVAGKGYVATIQRNLQMGGLEISFDQKPPRSVIDTIKGHGYRWSSRNKVWYAKDGPRAQAGAAALQKLGGEVDEGFKSFSQEVKAAPDPTPGVRPAPAPSAPAAPREPLVAEAVSHAAATMSGMSSDELDKYLPLLRRVEKGQMSLTPGDTSTLIPGNPDAQKRARRFEKDFARDLLAEHNARNPKPAPNQGPVPTRLKLPLAGDYAELKPQPNGKLQIIRNGQPSPFILHPAGGGTYGRNATNGSHFVYKVEGDTLVLNREGNGTTLTPERQPQNPDGTLNMIRSEGDQMERGELHVGDTKLINGVTYRLNANHRWERVEDVTAGAGNDLTEDEAAALSDPLNAAMTLWPSHPEGEKTRLLRVLHDAVEMNDIHPGFSYRLTNDPYYARRVERHAAAFARTMLAKLGEGQEQPQAAPEPAAPAPQPVTPPAANSGLPSGAIELVANMPAKRTLKRLSEDEAKDFGKQVQNQLLFKVRLGYDKRRHTLTIRHAKAREKWTPAEFDELSRALGKVGLGTIFGEVKPTDRPLYNQSGEIGGLQKLVPAQTPAPAPAKEEEARPDFLTALHDQLKDNSTIRNSVRFSGKQNGMIAAQKETKDAITQLAIARNELEAIAQHGDPDSIKTIAEQVYGHHAAQVATEDLTPEVAQSVLQAAVSKVEGEPDPAPEDVAELRSAVKNMQIVTGDTDENTSHVPTSPQDTPAPEGQKYLVGLPGKVSDRQRRAWNLAAERLVEEARAGRVLTVEERQTIARYSGNGGIGGSLNEYYTPPELGEAMWGILRGLGSGTGEGLEPSSGPGVMAQFAGDDAHMDMVELSPTSAGIANALWGHRHDVHSMGFEAFRARNPEVRYDFQIGNPPFGERDENRMLDSDYQGIREASRYFTLSTLDHLKEGGISVMVLPAGLARNKTDAEFRARVLARAEVLAIHGLPTDTFKAAGTETATTDVWVLRGRPEEVRGILDSAGEEGLKFAGIHDAAFISGKWHEAHPEQMHGVETTRSGQAGAQIYARDGQLTPELLQQIQAATPNPEAQKVPTQDELLEHFKDNPKALAGWLKKSRGKEGETRISEAGNMQICINGHWRNVNPETPAAHNAASQIGDLISLHATVLNHGDHERANQLRGSIERLLKEYVGKYGNPHDNEDLKKLSKGGSTLNNILGAINPDGSLAPRYAEDAEKQETPVNVSDPQSVLSHLRRTKQPATLAAIRRVMGDSFEEETAERLIDQGFAYHPERGVWMNPAEFYSGDSNDVKRILEHAASDSNPAWMKKALAKQTEELARRTPVVPLSEFEVTPRDTFVPKDVLVRYLMDSYVRDQRTYDVDSSQLDKWITRNADGSLGVHIPAWGGGKKVMNFLSRYLTGYRATAREADDYQALNEGFKDWLAENDEARTKVENAYAERGVWLEPTWNSDPVDSLIPGWRGKEEGGMTLHDFQNEAIHRSLAQGGGIIALDVGLGKTATAIAQMLYAKSAGMAQRPAAAVPKSVIGQWRQTALQVKPDAKILVIGAEQALNPDGTPQLDERGEEVWNEVTGAAALDAQMSKAKGQDYDMVLVTHTTLGRVQFDQAQQLQMIEDEFYSQGQDKYGKGGSMSGAVFQHYAKLKAQEMIDQGELSLDDLKEAGQKLADLDRELKEKYAAKKIQDNEQKKKEKKEKEEERKRLKFLYTAERALSKEDAHPLKTTWDELGFDHLVVDEAHEFKGLWTYNAGRSKPVKYLGAPAESSQRAVDLYYKCKAMREANAGRGVYLLTATPIKNSPVELFNMLSYTAPEMFKRLGIHNLDQFVERYCKIEEAPTVDPETGETKYVRALVGLQNLTELRREAGRYINRKTAEQVGLTLPFNDREVIHVEPKKEQSDMIKWIAANPAAAAVKYLGAEAPVIHPDDSDAVKSAKQQEIDKLAERYALALPHLTSRAELDMEMLEPEQYKGYVSPKVQHLLDELSGVAERGEKAVVFCDTVNMPGYGGDGKINPHGYSFHEKLKHLIHERTGVPLDQIALVNAQTCPDSEDRLEVSNGVKSGKYRIVIGNTATMGQGINLQHGVANLLNLDVPWNPAIDQQRQGRVVRQGNTSATVNNRTFLGTRGLDKDMYDVLQGKGVWYNEFWNGEGDTMETESQGGYRMTPERLAALALDDPEERKAALEAITQKETQARQLGLRHAAIKQFKKLQTAHKSLESARRTLQTATTPTERQRAAVDALERSIKAATDKLRGNPAFAPYAQHLDNPNGVMLDPDSGRGYRYGDRITTTSHGQPLSLFIGQPVKGKPGMVEVADVDLSGQPRPGTARYLKLSSIGAAEQEPYDQRKHLVDAVARGEGRYSAPGSGYLTGRANEAYQTFLKQHGDAIAEGLKQRDATLDPEYLQREKRLVMRDGKAALIGAHEVRQDDTYLTPHNEEHKAAFNALSASLGDYEYNQHHDLREAGLKHHFDVTRYGGKPMAKAQQPSKARPSDGGSLSSLYTQLTGKR